MATLTKKPARPKQARATKSAKGAAPAAWWEETVEAPRLGVPDAEKQAKRQRRWRLYVWATLLLLPLALFGNVAQLTSGTGSAATASVRDAFAQTRPVALVAVRQWLAADPSPLPGATLIGWDKATVEKFKPAPGEDNDTYRVETHYVSLSTPDGILYTSTVPVAVSKTNGAVPLATPSLTPVAPAATWSPDAYPNFEKAAFSDAVETAVANWATAYTSGDPLVLRQAVRDESDRSYTPLAGATLSDVDVVDAYAVSFPEDADVDADPSVIFARVEASIAWGYAPPAEDADPAPVSFDVLIYAADTAAPFVVAWGGPGTGPTLKRYGNAVTGREIDPVAPAEPESGLPAAPAAPTTPAPTATPAPAAAPAPATEGARP